MSRHVILFGFIRGSAGDTIEVSAADAGILMDAGLIGPALQDTADDRETKVVEPETKEGTDADAAAAGLSKPRRQRGDAGHR